MKVVPAKLGLTAWVRMAETSRLGDPVWQTSGFLQASWSGVTANPHGGSIASGNEAGDWSKWSVYKGVDHMATCVEPSELLATLNRLADEAKHARS